MKGLPRKALSTYHPYVIQLLEQYNFEFSKSCGFTIELRIIFLVIWWFWRSLFILSLNLTMWYKYFLDFASQSSHKQSLGYVCAKCFVVCVAHNISFGVVYLQDTCKTTLDQYCKRWLAFSRKELYKDLSSCSWAWEVHVLQVDCTRFYTNPLKATFLKGSVIQTKYIFVPFIFSWEFHPEEQIENLDCIRDSWHFETSRLHLCVSHFIWRHFTSYTASKLLLLTEWLIMIEEVQWTRKEVIVTDFISLSHPPWKTETVSIIQFN